MAKWRSLFIISLVFLSLAGCRQEDMFGDDLAVARQAHSERDWPLAERVLGRYLREERDPDKRWQAWNLLLEAMNGASQEPRASLDCLEAMLVEYEEDETKMAAILWQMGRYNQSLRHYDRAANAWSAYTELESLEPQKRVEGYRYLAAAQLSQRQFEAAEETLQQCLALPASDHDKVWCMLDLADASMGREQWEDVADLCQQILDSEPDAQVAGLAGYLYGDALEQMGRHSDALRQFEQARAGYPNPAVIDNRINWLKKQMKKK